MKNVGYNPYTLEKKTILISGASSGIGKSVALECARMGADLIITGRNKERLTDTFLNLDGDHHDSKAVDLTNPVELSALADMVPSLDGIVHCAGMVKTLPFQFVNRQDLNSLMEINFIAPVLLTQMLIKQKKLKK